MNCSQQPLELTRDFEFRYLKSGKFKIGLPYNLKTVASYNEATII